MSPASPIHREWRNRVIAEYRSAALAAQVSHWMIQCGLEDRLLRIALRVVADELDHAELSHSCLLALGGEDQPAALQVDHLAHPPTGDVLTDLLDSITANFCLGETLAVPLFNAMRVGTTHPVALQVLTRVLQDESTHRAFGWDVLDALLQLDPTGVRAHLGSTLPGILAGFERSYAFAPSLDAIRPEERAAGLLSLAEYAQVFWSTIRGDIYRRFRDRQIDIPVRYQPAATGPSAG